MPRKHLLSYLILFIILIIGAFLRLYRISDYMSFLGDEGRDVLIVKRMIVDHKFTLLGPITSVGLMYLGPIYYYFTIPFLWIAKLDPVGPAVMVAFFSLATIWLIWKICREYLDEFSAIIAATFYAISPFVIRFSHSSWNPNILPFWSLLLIYSLLQVYCKRKFYWLVVTGICFGIVIQLHYVSLVFLPITICVLALLRFRIPKKIVFWGGISALITYSPFIVFEIKHKFINTITIWQFVTRTGDAKTFSLLPVIGKFWDLTERLFWRFVVIENAEMTKVFFFLVVGISGYVYFKHTKEEMKKKFLMVLFVWYVVGLGLLSLYAGSVYDYYLFFISTLPFLLAGMVFSHLWRNPTVKLFSLLLFFAISYFELIKSPLLIPPNRLAAQAREISQFIVNKVDGRRYNFAIIAEHNSDHAYRYFLEILGHSPVVVENPYDDPGRLSVMPELFIVCEEKECKPLGLPLWEIAGFGRAEITDEWSVGLFKVLRLVHYQEPVL